MAYVIGADWVSKYVDGIQVVSSEPSLTVMDPESDAPDVGDPRPIAAAVLAMHRARQF